MPSSGALGRALSVVRVLVIIQLVYLALVNGALQLQLTQTIINKIRPEKFHVSWDNAWSWYPFRVHATGVAANGQSRSQQWQVNAASASGSIAILPLLAKRVWLDDVSATDVDYRQRPRLKPDRDYSLILPFYPDIEGREVAPADTSPRKKRRAWHLDMEDIEASGTYNYWIYNMKGSASGTLKADMTFQTQGGPFSLSGRDVDLTLQTHYINGDNKVFDGGDIQGELGFSPFVPRENKGIKLLNYAQLDVDIDVGVEDLGFINLFTGGIGGLTIGGAGHVQGHLHLDQGQVLPVTDLQIDANDLNAVVFGHSFQGEGEVELGFAPQSEDTTRLSLLFSSLDAYRDGEPAPLLQGRDLSLALEGDTYILPDGNAEDAKRALFLEVEGIDIPDLALFQHYLPEQWPMSLKGGEGRLQLDAKLATDALSLAINITSEEADMGLRQYNFSTDLDFAIKLLNPAIRTSSTRFDGSYIKLTGARLQREQRADTGTWDAAFKLNEGELSLLDPEVKKERGDGLDLLKLLGETNTREMLGNADGTVDFEAHVSSLAWISVLLSEKFHSSFSGRGDMQGRLEIRDSLPRPGTRAQINSGELQVSFLDYISEGEGEIVFVVKDDIGGELPDWHMAVDLTEANLKRKGETAALIVDADIALRAMIEDMTFEKGRKELSLALLIESANVTDMAAFNSYLPPDSPIAITEGTAELNADILLKQDDADGWLTLRSEDLLLRADEQEVEGNLKADITLAGGIPEEMTFDISGSSLRLDEVTVRGKDETFEEDDWYAQIDLSKGVTTWTQPPELDATARITIRDSRPVVAMFSNRVRSPKWLLKMLTIEDVVGDVKLQAADNRITIPLAHAISDKLELGAKAVIQEGLRDGVIYARYNKLDALLKINDGKKNLDVLNARKKYDNYRLAP